MTFLRAKLKHSKSKTKRKSRNEIDNFIRKKLVNTILNKYQKKILEKKD